MDRFLIAGAALLLILEVTFLVTDFDDSSKRARASSHSERSIGAIVEKTNSVHRRGANTLIWDETQKSDPLYAFDSVLTLTGSSAHLALEGETKLDLDQDTLVVLEPNGEASDGRLKIRFSRGSMRTRNAVRPLEISEDEMKISTEPGTDLHLAGLLDGRLHVEVEAGAAKIETSSGSETIAPGERVFIREGMLEEKTKTVSELKWIQSLPKRVYVDRFPARVEVGWTGEASSIKTLDAKRSLASISTSEKKTVLNLGEGLSRIWLESTAGTSDSIEIEARTNPPLRHFSPLPRDRVVAGQDVVFAWEPASGFDKYKVELSRQESFETIERSLEVSEPRAQMKTSELGSFYWRVKATDELGLEVRPSNPTQFVVVPSIKLEAPTLNAPEIREPAEETPSRDGAHLIFDLLVPRAYAEAKQVEAVLSWQPIAGAEFYMIEISSTPGFEAPLVNKKVTDPKYVHRGPRGAQVFWRVAAGASDVVGPFSAAATLKLEGVKAVVQVQKAEPPKSAPTPLPTPVPIAVAAAPAAAESVQPASAESKPETPAPVVSFGEKANRNRGRFSYSPQLRQTETHNDLDVTGRFSGLVLLSFGANLYLFENEKGRVELGLAYESTEWKPQTSPRQTTVREERMSYSLGYRKKTSPWSFVLAGESFPVLTRKASEEAELQSQALWGVDIRYSEAMLRGVADFEFGLRTGSGLSGGHLRGSLDYPLWGSSYYAGPHVSIEAFNSDTQRKLNSAVAGAHFGVGW